MCDFPTDERQRTIGNDQKSKINLQYFLKSIFMKIVICGSMKVSAKMLEKSGMNFKNLGMRLFCHGIRRSMQR